MKNYLSEYNFEFKDREKSKPAAPGKKKPNTYVKFNDKKDMDQSLWMLNDNPTFADVNAEVLNLKKIIRAGKNQNPPKKFLLTCLFAGHGMIQNNF